MNRHDIERWHSTTSHRIVLGRMVVGTCGLVAVLVTATIIATSARRTCQSQTEKFNSES